MQAPHHRKIELQSSADLSYLYSNTVAFLKEQLDVHFPPSKNSQDGSSDPIEKRVKELVEDFILRTFKSATPSISINGLDVATVDDSSDDASTAKTNTATNLNQIDPNVTTFSFKTQSAVEYEPYDANLAAKVTALYAKLENLTTDVAKLRREAPRKAARNYAEELQKAVKRDDERAEEERRRRDRKVFEGDGGDNDDNEEEENKMVVEGLLDDGAQRDAGGAVAGTGVPLQEIPPIHTANNSNANVSTTTTATATTATTLATTAAAQSTSTNDNITWALPDPNRRRSARLRQKHQGQLDAVTIRPEWKLTVPFATEAQQDRWRSGDVADVYSRALRTLIQLQGDETVVTKSAGAGFEDEDGDEDGKVVSRALATTVGKLERSRKAVDVVEGIAKKGRNV